MTPGFGAPVSMCQASRRFLIAWLSAALSLALSHVLSSARSSICARASSLAYGLSVAGAFVNASWTAMACAIGGFSLRCALSSAERLPASLACSTVNDGLGMRCKRRLTGCSTQAEC